MPLFEAHDRDQIEIYCYSSGSRTDRIADRFRALADRWVSIVGVTDDISARRIKADGIDILIDLAGHTNNNRLRLFARKPAPVQVSWLGYPNTTGLPQIDYRITDAIADPYGDADELHTEKLVRLEGGFLCYRNDEYSSPVETSPQPQRRVTLGSFNTLAKVTAQVLDTWTEILNVVPDSRLVLKARSLGNEEARTACLEQFVDRGVAPERIELFGPLPDAADHLRLYTSLDIALDPFPYNGTTTTCEALWMGVPVITLRGKRHAGRVSASILHHIRPGRPGC